MLPKTKTKATIGINSDRTLRTVTCSAKFSPPIRNNSSFAKILKINCCGIDYISKDITKDFNNNKNVILEVNGTPDTEIHTKLNNYGNYFFENVVNNIF